MKTNKIGCLTTITLDLRAIAGAEVGEHIIQFSDVIQEILKRVLTEIAGPNEKVEVDIMTPEEMSNEAAHHGDDPCDYVGKLCINVTQEFTVPPA